MTKISKLVAFLAVVIGLGLGLHSSEVEAVAGDGFYNVPKVTYLEAGDKFSTVNGIKLIEDGEQKNYSVYLYKSKTGYRRVSSTHYIDTRINGNYMIRYESASGKHRAWRRVIVKDTKKPYFTGIKDVTVNYGSKFSTTKGITAYDLATGKRGYSIYYNNKKVGKKNYINTKKVGFHKLRYEVTDKNGLKTIAYRNVKVLPKIVKTSKQKTATKIKRGKTITIYPKLNNDSGFWYQRNIPQLYVHSWRGESINHFNKGDIVKFKVSGKTYQYQIYDKFICYAQNTGGMYTGVPYGKAWVASSRNKYMKKDIDDAPLVFQTCQDGGWSKVKIYLAKPYNSAKWYGR